MAADEFARQELTLGADTLTALLTAMIAATWVHHDVDFSTAGDALITSPKADPDLVGPTDWQASMRRDGAGMIVLGIEPSGSITAAGTTGAIPPNTSADFSGETSDVAGVPTPPEWHGFQLNSVIGAGSVYELVEGVDFWQLLIGHPSTTHYVCALQIGKIYAPPDIEDPGNGRDGLGFLCGRPDVPTQSSGADEFLASGNGVSTCSSVLHTGTNKWEPAGMPFIPINFGQSSDPDFKPYPYPCAGRHNRGTNGNQALGHYKYVRAWHTGRTSKTRQESLGGDSQAWIHVDDLGTTVMLLPWQKAEAPA